jgi:hypothetical protein
MPQKEIVYSKQFNKKISSYNIPTTFRFILDEYTEFDFSSHQFIKKAEIFQTLLHKIFSSTSKFPKRQLLLQLEEFILPDCHLNYGSISFFDSNPLDTEFNLGSILIDLVQSSDFNLLNFIDSDVLSFLKNVKITSPSFNDLNNFSISIERNIHFF